jgi:hypothetical protein
MVVRRWKHLSPAVACHSTCTAHATHLKQVAACRELGIGSLQSSLEKRAHFVM